MTMKLSAIWPRGRIRTPVENSLQFKSHHATFQGRSKLSPTLSGSSADGKRCDLCETLGQSAHLCHTKDHHRINSFKESFPMGFEQQKHAKRLRSFRKVTTKTKTSPTPTGQLSLNHGDDLAPKEKPATSLPTHIGVFYAEEQKII